MSRPQAMAVLCGPMPSVGVAEHEALACSTGWIGPPHPEIGYLPLAAANALVASGRYEFVQVCAWGYVVRPR